MAAVKQRGNKTTELRFLAVIKDNKLKGWRRQYKVVGTPDFAWPKEKVAVFLDGCFWHGCPTCWTSPVSNKKYWIEKVRRNRMRDESVTSLLKLRRWVVIRIWECAIEETRSVRRLQRALSLRNR